jgi:hypothetical protein
MKYKINQIVFHNLTNEKFLVISYEIEKRYMCRGADYQLHTFEEEEIRPEISPLAQSPRNN